MTDRETMRLALEALEKDPAPLNAINNAKCFLYSALEQPEQESDCNPHPDAPHGFNRDASHNLERYVCECEGWDPPRQEPVNHIPDTTKMIEPSIGLIQSEWAGLEQPPNSTTGVVEPVAWVGEATSGYRELDWDKTDLQREYPFVYPLYTSPPKREWVGLTDEEIDHIWGITKPDYEDLFDLPRAIEAKLRAKNGF